MNITDTIAPNVDQLTADHLTGRTLTIRVTGVKLSKSEQPCEIDYEGCQGLPYRPGKSMRRVLVHAWGDDVNTYVGRSLRLYRDEDVVFGGLKVGGIRISHMSHITSALTIALTAKKGSKRAFRVQPLVEEPATDPRVEAGARDLIARITVAADDEALQLITADEKVVKSRAWLREKRPDLAAQVDEAVAARLEALADTPAEAAP